MRRLVLVGVLAVLSSVPAGCGGSSGYPADDSFGTTQSLELSADALYLLENDPATTAARSR